MDNVGETVSAQAASPVLKPASSLQPLGCPWCGDGTQLLLRGDGVGGSALWCRQCLCKGPTVEIDGDFERSDMRTIERWSNRSTSSSNVDPALLERLQRMISLHMMIASSGEGASVRVPVGLDDLHTLLQAAGVGTATPQQGSSERSVVGSAAA